MARETAGGILVAGGDADPNLRALVAGLRERGLACEALLVGARSHPRVTWDLQTDVLQIDGQERRPAAVFLRYDVFTGRSERRPAAGFRAAAWFTTLAGWAYAHPDVRIFNRASTLRTPNKLYVLKLAQEAGLPIPVTVVSNDHALLSEQAAARRLVVKPVNGGDYTRELPDVLARAPRRDKSLAAPAIVQEQLVPPEVRVYGIGGRFFGFRLVADALDYRAVADCKVIPLAEEELPAPIVAGLGALMGRLHMDFGAADFKACPQTGELRFLELNTGPMFVAFDAACDRALTRAMGDFLSAPADADAGAAPA